ncbi:hypothetical protein SLEP1_g37172 [Rubroshorea leprosula]|uniref:Peptidase M16 N-terminal domain-containing protein n=1 Tax=Rubroshorea leprosula TaxID=152421 RepID=A0AAV5KTS1_9ROSI|nr:hypothetical protein SLEP1_g37172 [Rubroshorea leprosula]
MAFKSTINRSHLRVVREVEAIGGNAQALASRKQMGCTFDALKTYGPPMVKLRIDCVRHPASLHWKVSEQQLHKVKAEIIEASNNHRSLLLEAIHSASYSWDLANPLLAPESAINILNSTILEEFVVISLRKPDISVLFRQLHHPTLLKSSAASTPENPEDVSSGKTLQRSTPSADMYLHMELLSVAVPLLSDLPKILCPVEPQFVYVGSDYHCQADSRDATHFAIAFELPGGWQKDKEAMALTVL